MSAIPPMSVPFHRNPRNQKFAVPALIVILLIAWFVVGRNRSASEKDVAREAARVAAVEQIDTLKQSGLIATPTTEAASKPPPNYDYLTCTHTKPGDPECVKLFPYELTGAAKELIGWQGGQRGGTLNTDNTRSIVEQIRKMPDVDACNMYLFIGPSARQNGSLERIVYPDGTHVADGAVKLYDCTPKAATPVTAPTKGA